VYLKYNIKMEETEKLQGRGGFQGKEESREKEKRIRGGERPAGKEG